MGKDSSVRIAVYDVKFKQQSRPGAQTVSPGVLTGR